MNDERIGSELAGLLEKARPELTPELETRAVAAMREARPRRLTRRRLIAVAVGAAVALFGLGFVPVPMGEAKGVLDRAMATCEGATGLHIVYHMLRDGTDSVHEVWYATGGLGRTEDWRNGELSGAYIWGKDFTALYNATTQTADVDDQPPGNGPKWSALVPGYEQILTESYIAQYPKATLSEWRERSLWGGEVDICEVVLPVPGDTEERKVKIRVETDAATGKLLSKRQWESDGDNWHLVIYTEEVTWDADVPSGAFEFVPPRGTKVTYHRWWRGRYNQTLAMGQTQDWRVKVHALDAKDNGDLILTLSRYPAPGTPEPDWKEVAVKIDAVDDLGAQYHDDMGDGRLQNSSWVTTLHRDASAVKFGSSRSLEATIHFAGPAANSEQTMTLPNLPIPPAQAEADLYRPEVVQY